LRLSDAILSMRVTETLLRGDDRTQEIARLAAYLRDIREAWAAASPEH